MDFQEKFERMMVSIFKKVLREERVTLIAILDQEFTLRYLNCIEELF